MAKAKDIPGFDGRKSFRAIAREAVTVRSREVFEHAAGVLDTEDIERVHDMRVATRRLRAVLEVFAPAFDPDEHKRALKEVKALADALGARRDPDVQLAALAGIAAQLPGPDQPGIEAFAAQIRDEQRAGNATLAAALKKIEDDDLRGRLDRLVAEAVPSA
ncbi:MAG TPA: CHAD domain-containing protein [Baekduia sp.]